MRMLYLGWLVLAAGCLTPPARGWEDESFAKRAEGCVQTLAKQPLRQGPNPETWVDAERWCVAHACLVRKERLPEANQYLAEVQWCSLWHGLVADTDVQVTDLLRTYLAFRNDERLQPPARAHLRELFRAWTVPNPDRNRTADRTYEWPCEYTENHSLNILVGAYLIDVVLDRDRALRRGLLQQFLDDRAKWGWSEFHSPNYADVTAKALTLLVDFAPDEGLARAAAMHLDVLALEFANHSLGHWRGVPFARGYGRQTNNNSNSIVGVAQLWFGNLPPDVQPSGSFLAHLATSKYRPPQPAVELFRNPALRGTYTMTQTATHGPAKLRIPLRTYVTPSFTISSAQGFGSFYDACYWTISFASSADRVITGRYGRGRNLVQVDNVLVTFGDVTWHGPLQPEVKDNMRLGGDGRVVLAQLDLAPDCHLLLGVELPLAVEESLPTPAMRLAQLGATFTNGVVAWKMPDGRAVRMVNERDGEFWRVTQLTINGEEVMLDDNMLYNTPWLRSERDSRVVDVRWGDQGWRYDFRDPANPRILPLPGTPFAALPPARVVGPLGMEFIRIPAGEFVQGSPVGEGRDNERPQHWVTLPAFSIGKTEVTVGQWKQYLAANPKATPLPEWYLKDWGKTDQHPIAWVSQPEAEAFCQWLAGLGQGRYRLPTEAEWEKAAKGYAHRAYPWGDHYDGTQSGSKNGVYLPVGTMPTDRSPFGVLDLGGNLWEWCADGYPANAYGVPPLPGPPERIRVVRGCGWNFDPDTFRCSYRTGLALDQRSLHLGFRVVREE